jgi:hypothetical protein
MKVLSVKGVLVDILEHHDGVYLSKKVKKKGKTGRRKRAG